MADARQIAELLVQSGRTGTEGARDVSFHTGLIGSWDSITGQNTVIVGGTSINDVRTLSSGVGVLYSPGETVVLIKKQSQYFILGRVGAANASVPSGVQSASDNFVTTFGTGGVWGNPPTGSPRPAVTVTIGPSRSALIFYRCNIKCKAGDPLLDPATIFNPFSLAAISFAVSGASTIAPDSWVGQAALLQFELQNAPAAGAGLFGGVLVTVSGFMAMTSFHGLNSGTNTFTMKYRTPQAAEFQVPAITVIPL